MKRLGILLVATAASALLSSTLMAACLVQLATIPEVYVGASGARIYVRQNTPGATTFTFFTNNVFLATAALSAQASHEQVTAIGNAASCPAPVNGLSDGGTLVNLHVSP